MDVISMRMTARQWATVDATMDNAAQAAIDEYEDDALPVSVREAGWAQVPWIGDDRSWPPDERIITIVLSREQWDLVVTALAADDAVYDQLNDHESVDLGRDAHRIITQQLDTSGP
jgi:hypothetical protein